MTATTTPPSRFRIVATTESDRTYIARLNFITDVLGDETQQPSESFLIDYTTYVTKWNPEHGGVIAWDEHNIPAGGAWLIWGDGSDPAYGHIEHGIPEIAIAVEARYRGQGLGTELLKGAIKAAKDAGAPGVSLAVAKANPRAKQLYERVGFKEHDFTAHNDHYRMIIRWG